MSTPAVCDLPWPKPQPFPSTLFLILMSSCLQQKANLARIRDNQRRSRARRREYLRELEQRIRVYELQGVEASSEVQQAARRVAEENRQLRGLLNRHGITDDYISSYLHTGCAAAQTDPTPIPNFPSSNPSDAVQSLQQVIAPRRPNPLEPDVSYVVPPQESREISIASALKSSSSRWEPGPAYQRDPANDQQFSCNVPPLTLPVPSDMHRQRQYFPVVPVTQAPLTEAPDSGATSELPRDHSLLLSSGV
ncbi:hypothetical protein BHE90_016868 [Fusarium euwallaceae]|uniref:BZIP domain-containing protein n=2 Tax=Fusarium solani species complex TaxID=232080 RepID=A0A430KZ70_9HYPO|nr:hypothetical protein CEP51_015092 [Fusarium floridanum]RTE68753.1 hypothetical protein BHE90_016868 [Fusarium euwallaceae]